MLRIVFAYRDHWLTGSARGAVVRIAIRGVSYSSSPSPLPSPNLTPLPLKGQTPRRLGPSLHQQPPRRCRTQVVL